MKLTCTRENFKKAIINSEKITAKQNTLPILNNLLFEAEKGCLKISATNLEIGIIIKIGANIEDIGKITIPAKIVSGLVNNLPNIEKIELISIGQNLKIKAGSIKAEIKGMAAEEFPLIPKKTTDFQLNLPTKELKKIILRALASASINEARQELAGINLILTEKELFFASTDSFRLSESRLALKKENTDAALYDILLKRGKSIIIPLATASEVSRIMSNTDDEGRVEIAIEEGQIFIDINGVTLVSRLINGKYPEYKHIIPKEFKTRIVGEKNALQGALRTASIFSAGRAGEVAVRINSLEKKLIIGAKSVETGENTSELKVDVSGADQEAVFNAKYLLDGISAMETSKVALLFNSESSPAAIKEIDEKTGEVLEDYVYIAMPIKN